MDGREITTAEALYMERAYGPGWYTLGPAWTSRFSEHGY
jgi:hypothetical protein